MFLRQITKSIAICISTITLVATVGRPEAISAQTAPDSRASNARSGPATGGVAGTVESILPSSFVVLTQVGQKMLVREASSTEYLKENASTRTSGITKGDSVLVLGMVNGPSITASQIIVQHGDQGGSANSSIPGVVPIQRGALPPAKRVGQIPASYSEGSGTIVNGIVADNATKAALVSYPGGIVDRVVELSDSEFEVHNIGVHWPHHIFVGPDFKVVGAF